MPRTKTQTIETLPAVDLVYAVRRLIAMRKTAPIQVLKLASERLERIGALQAELKALTVGTPVHAAPVAARPAAKVAKRSAAKKAAPPKQSAKQVASRQLQGKYMGLLRNFGGSVRDHIKGVAKAKGLPAGIAEMGKLLSTKAAPSRKPTAKPAPAKKAATKPAPRKLTISPKRAAQLHLQGTYIGMMRSLPVAEKAKIKAISKDKGMKAAIEVMKKLPGRK